MSHEGLGLRPVSGTYDPYKNWGNSGKPRPITSPAETIPPPSPSSRPQPPKDDKKK